MASNAVYNERWVEVVAPVLADLYDLGANTPAVCKELGMGKTTYYNLCATYPAFKAAHEDGVQRAEAYWCSLGEKGIRKEIPFHAIAWMFYMKCRFKWVDRQVIATESLHAEENEAPTLSPDEAKELLGSTRQTNKRSAGNAS